MVPIVRSIWLTVVALQCAQAALWGVAVVVFGIDPGSHSWLFVASPVVHAALGCALGALRNLFRLEPARTPLSRVNVANVLSMIRISSAPTLLWLVLLAAAHPVTPLLVPLTAIVFLTDLLDGAISRRTGQITRIGEYLDSTSDYMILGALAIVLVSYRLLPFWVFLVIVARLGLHAIGQLALFAARRGTIEFQSSFLGKASVFAIMTLFAVSLLQLVRLPGWYSTALSVLQYVVAGIAVLSLVEKLHLFIIEARMIRTGRA